MRFKNKDKNTTNISLIDQSSIEYQDNLKKFVSQQMKETNTLKVNKFGRKYKDWVEVVRKSNNIIE